MAAPAPRITTFAVIGSIAPAELGELCARISARLERSGAEIAFCELADAGSNVITVEVLARVQLAAKRHGCTVRLRDASSELLDLVALMGLRNVLVPEGS